MSVFFTTQLVDWPHHQYYTTDINSDSGEGQKVTDGSLKSEMQLVHLLPQIPWNSSWDVNGKRFFGSSHWKIPGTNRNSEKVASFSWLGRSKWKFFYRLQVSWVSYHYHVVTRIQSSAALQSGNFRQMVNDTYRSYGPKFPNQNFRNFFINGKQLQSPWASRLYRWWTHFLY